MVRLPRPVLTCACARLALQQFSLSRASPPVCGITADKRLNISAGLPVDDVSGVTGQDTYYHTCSSSNAAERLKRAGHEYIKQSQG
jgi:hypothetical protein